MSKEKQVAESILALVGGKENILSVEHCATRLRLVLKDATRFQKNEIEKIEDAILNPSDLLNKELNKAEKKIR